MDGETQTFSFRRKLAITASVIWAAISLLISLALANSDFDGFSKATFFVTLLITTAPIWLFWLLFWTFSGVSLGSKLKTIFLRFKVFFLKNISKNFQREGLDLPMIFWRGEAKLWQAWWLLWFLPNSCLRLFLQNVGNLNQIVAFSILVLMPVYLFFAPTIVWRCASKSTSYGWASLAKIFMVIGALLSLSQATSLQSTEFSLALFRAAFVFILLAGLFRLILFSVKQKHVEKIISWHLIPYAIALSYVFSFLALAFSSYR